MMTSRTEAVCVRFFLLRAPMLLVLFTAFVSMGCQKTADTPAKAQATPANGAVAVKPTETETKPADTTPAGKEIKPAEGPALKSIMPPDGAILGGVLNDIAADLPAPDSAAAKAANASGTVTVEVVVNEKGAVVASSVVSGPQPLWSAAGAAARQARFDPPLYNGKPVKVAGVLTYEFTK